MGGQEGRSRCSCGTSTAISTTPRWDGVHVAIRAGKCMPITATEVVVRFHRSAHDFFDLGTSAETNMLRFRIWPDAQIGLPLNGKKPGAAWVPRPRTWRSR